MVAARGERSRAEDMLRPLLVAPTGLDGLLDATQAGYFLGQPEAAVTAWEQALELMKGEISEAKPFGSANIGVAMHAAHAYTTLGSVKAEPLLAQKPPPPPPRASILLPLILIVSKRGSSVLLMAKVTCALSLAQKPPP